MNLLQLRRLNFNNKLVIKNFSFLMVLQLVNLAIPFLLYPKLISSLGSDVYGIVIYYQTIASYLGILYNFGFHTSATKSIALNRDNKCKLNEIINSVYVIKFVLFLSSLFVVFVAFYFINQVDTRLFILSLGGICYEFLFPIWYFQGIERMKFVTFYYSISRIFSFILIITFVHTKSDYLLVPFFQFLCMFIVTVFAIIRMMKMINYKFTIPSWSILKSYISESFSFFLSSVMIILRDKTALLLIGNTLSMSDVTIYDLSTKITTMVRQPFLILKDVLFPQLSKVKDQNKFRKLLLLIILSSILVTSVAYLFVPFVTDFLSKGTLIQALEVTRLMLLSVPLAALSMFVGLGVIIFKKHIHFMYSVLFSCCIYLLLLYFAYYFNIVTLINLVYISIFALALESLARMVILKRKIVLLSKKMIYENFI